MTTGFPRSDRDTGQHSDPATDVVAPAISDPGAVGPGDQLPRQRDDPSNQIPRRRGEPSNQIPRRRARAGRAAAVAACCCLHGFHSRRGSRRRPAPAECRTGCDRGLRRRPHRAAERAGHPAVRFGRAPGHLGHGGLPTAASARRHRAGPADRPVRRPAVDHGRQPHAAPTRRARKAGTMTAGSVPPPVAAGETHAQPAPRVGGRRLLTALALAAAWGLA